MNDRLSILVVALLGIIGLAYPRHGHAGSSDLKAWFQTRTQALFDAIATGDKTIWEQTLDDDGVITTEDGEVQGKARFLSELKPLPRGFVGRGVIRDLTVQDLGSAAVVHYFIEESENIFGQELKTTYVETDTFRRRAGTWKIVAAQVTVVPRDLEPITRDSSRWAGLLGDYRFPGDEQIRYRVFERNGALYGGRDEKSASNLIALAPLTFFQSGSIHTMIFVQDSAGHIAEVREIHKYNEVRMQHVTH
jgi:hypothetical protein